MDVVVNKLSINGIKLFNNYSRISRLLQRFASSNPRGIINEQKTVHPYRNIHPWKSLDEFSESLVKGVVYNEDGLVAVNKPYGISGRSQPEVEKRPTGIVNNVDYTLSDATDHIASALGYSKLKLIKTPEKLTSGIAIFAADNKVESAVLKSLCRAQGMGVLCKSYWVVTTRVPNEIKGEMRLAMRQEDNPEQTGKQPVIISSWSKAEQKAREIKVLNVQFKVLSNSTQNLSSLIEIRASTAKWYAQRLFCATVLFSPILGDNRYGSRIKKVLGKWVNVSPFVDAAKVQPQLNKELLELIRIPPGKEKIIPIHLHLREMFLPMYKTKSCNLTITAPPMPEFMWTCQQLEFKQELFGVDENFLMDVNDNYDPIKKRVVT